MTNINDFYVLCENLKIDSDTISSLLELYKKTLNQIEYISHGSLNIGYLEEHPETFANPLIQKIRNMFEPKFLNKENAIKFVTTNERSFVRTHTDHRNTTLFIPLSVNNTYTVIYDKDNKDPSNGDIRNDYVEVETANPLCKINTSRPFILNGYYPHAVDTLDSSTPRIMVVVAFDEEIDNYKNIIAAEKSTALYQIDQKDLITWC
jgi:hypothetical protein